MRCRSALGLVVGLWTFLPQAGQGADPTPIVGLPTSETALVGRFNHGPVDLPLMVDQAEFKTLFASSDPTAWPAEIHARQFFDNSGSVICVVRVAEAGPLQETLLGGPVAFTGLHALSPISDLRLLIMPELSLLPGETFAAAFEHVGEFVKSRRVFMIVDPRPGLSSALAVVNWVDENVPTDAAFCAAYFPYLNVSVNGVPRPVGASGAMAAIYSRNDVARGIWRSPSGTGWPLQAQVLEPALTSSDFDLLNVNGISVIREFANIGIVPFGARSLDRANADDRFISVVRTRDWVAASIERALAFAALEQNAEPLWGQIRARVEDFLLALFRQGALVGATPDEAFFVRCDSTTTTPLDILNHRVNVVYGLALLRANEFDITVLSSPTYDALAAVPRPTLHARAFGGELFLAYSTVPGFRYFLESSMDLASWVGEGSPIDGDGAWRRPILPMTGAGNFFRLRIVTGTSAP